MVIIDNESKTSEITGTTPRRKRSSRKKLRKKAWGDRMDDESKTSETTTPRRKRKKTWGDLMIEALQNNYEVLEQVTNIFPPTLNVNDPHEDCSYGMPGELMLFWTDNYVYSPSLSKWAASFFVSVPRNPVDENRFPIKYDCFPREIKPKKLA